MSTAIRTTPAPAAAPTRGEAWEAYFTTTARLQARMESTLKSSCSLSLPDYNVLMRVARAGESGLRPGALAEHVVFSPSRLTHTLRRLRDRGLVERNACDTDGRGGVITLTAQGRELYARAAQVHRTLVRTLALEGMTPEEAEVLDRVFTRIATRLSTT